jgi:hypothetical protein
VRLVHHEQRHVRLGQLLHGLLARQLLGREKEELELLVGQLLEALLAPLLGHRRVDRGRVARLLLVDVLDLVALERDQRRDHERRAVDHPTGELIDRRLPRAGGHHDQRVGAGEHRAHRVLLAGAQLLEPEALTRHLRDVVRFTHMLTSSRKGGTLPGPWRT